MTDTLDTLAADLDLVLVRVQEFLAKNPSAKIAHHLGAASGLLSALRLHATVKAPFVPAKVDEDRRKYSPFDLQMAARFVNDDGSIGLPIEDFLRWREQRASEMARVKPLDQQLEVLKR